jgi:hypothetical protein
MKQAWQKHLAPYVLALSISWTAIEHQKIVVGRTTTIKRARKSWAKKPTSESSFIQHRNDDNSNDLQKKKKEMG